MIFDYIFSYQKAALLHRTVADRNKLRKKTKKTRRKREEETAISLPKPLSAGRLFQPRVMKALEKDLKKKSKSSKPWDFSSYYRGNLLHVSVNSDSDTSEDSIDSISVEFWNTSTHEFLNVDRENFYSNYWSLEIYSLYNFIQGDSLYLRCRASST